MGACVSIAGAPAAAFANFTGGSKLTKEQIHMIDLYLPDFRIYDQSTELHRQVASSHWHDVFSEARDSVSRVSRSYSTNKISVKPVSERDPKCESSDRTATASNTQTGSKIGLLYDHFYSYLDQHSPELKPLFRSSLRVKGKVLVHISAGMRSILASEHVADKMAALTKTHLQFGVQLEHFNPLGKALLSAIAIVSEGAWTDEVADAWRRLFTHCSAMLMVHQKKMMSSKHVGQSSTVATAN